MITLISIQFNAGLTFGAGCEGGSGIEIVGVLHLELSSMLVGAVNWLSRRHAGICRQTSALAV